MIIKVWVLLAIVMGPLGTGSNSWVFFSEDDCLAAADALKQRPGSRATVKCVETEREFPQ